MFYHLLIFLHDMLDDAFPTDEEYGEDYRTACETDSVFDYFDQFQSVTCFVTSETGNDNLWVASVVEVIY